MVVIKTDKWQRRKIRNLVIKRAARSQKDGMSKAARKAEARCLCDFAIAAAKAAAKAAKLDGPITVTCCDHEADEQN